MLRRLGVLIATCAVWATVAALAAGADEHVESADPQRALELQAEPRAEELRAAVVAAGALDIYWDDWEYVVVLPKGGPPIPTAVWRELNLPAPVRFESAHVTHQDLDAVEQRLRSASAEARQQLGFYLDVRTGRIVVEGPDDAAMRTALAADFGSRVEYTVTPKRTLNVDRDHDRQPFSGGARYTNNRFFPSSGDIACTTGFTVFNSVEYMVSAGHCTPDTNYFVWTWDGADLGLITHANLTIDSLLIANYDYGATIYDTGYSHRSKVIGGGNPVVGATYCVSGGFSWPAECNKEVEAVGIMNLCGWEDGVCRDKVVRYSNETETGGDSGGPMYFPAAGDCVYARGIHIGEAVVGNDGYATQWNGILNKWDVSTRIDNNC